MPPQPIYTAEALTGPAYQLRYTWSGWPSAGKFPPPPADTVFHGLDGAWEQDGLRRLEQNWGPEMIQFTFSVKPHVSPTVFAARVKGRLQHALRAAGVPTAFSRKLGVRTIGDNTATEVETYIRKQVDKEPLADPRFRDFLRQFTVLNPDVNLDQPTASNSGRYWYNLHLVLVVTQRYRLTDETSLATLRDWSLAVAKKKGHAISALSVMPDHLHAALRRNINDSPQEIALGFLNNLAYGFGQKPIWQNGYYVGTFSEYTMGAVRTAGGDDAEEKQEDGTGWP
ncbi:MAG TPA: transposase [Candidatus Anammoximicrobium sp.]|nr:transposase [Candidatus Anammoximicrobium sp.]